MRANATHLNFIIHDREIRSGDQLPRSVPRKIQPRAYVREGWVARRRACEIALSQAISDGSLRSMRASARGRKRRGGERGNLNRRFVDMRSGVRPLREAERQRISEAKSPLARFLCIAAAAAVVVVAEAGWIFPVSSTRQSRGRAFSRRRKAQPDSRA